MDHVPPAAALALRLWVRHRAPTGGHVWLALAGPAAAGHHTPEIVDPACQIAGLPVAADVLGGRLDISIAGSAGRPAGDITRSPRDLRSARRSPAAAARPGRRR